MSKEKRIDYWVGEYQKAPRSPAHFRNAVLNNAQADLGPFWKDFMKEIYKIGAARIRTPVGPSPDMALQPPPQPAAQPAAQPAPQPAPQPARQPEPNPGGAHPVHNPAVSDKDLLAQWVEKYRVASVGDERRKVFMEADDVLRPRGLLQMFWSKTGRMDDPRVPLSIPAPPFRPLGAPPSGPAPAPVISEATTTPLSRQIGCSPPPADWVAPVPPDWVPLPAEEDMEEERALVKKWTKIYEVLEPEDRHQCLKDARASLTPRGWFSFVKSVHEVDAENKMWNAPPPNWEPEHPLRGQVPRLRDTWTQDEESLLEAQARPRPGMVNSEAQTGVKEKEPEKSWEKSAQAFREDTIAWTDNMKWLLGKRNEVRNLMPDLLSSDDEGQTETEATDTEYEGRAARAQKAGLKHIYEPQRRRRRRRRY
jgi:hypothetical protein